MPHGMHLRIIAKRAHLEQDGCSRLTLACQSMLTCSLNHLPRVDFSYSALTFIHVLSEDEDHRYDATLA